MSRSGPIRREGEGRFALRLGAKDREAIVKVVRDEIAPELSVPRWVSPLQAFRVLTPPLYRWGVRRTRRGGTANTKP